VRREWRGAATVFAVLGLLVPVYVLFSIIIVRIIFTHFQPAYHTNSAYIAVVSSSLINSLVILTGMY